MSLRCSRPAETSSATAVDSTLWARSDPLPRMTWLRVYRTYDPEAPHTE
jgi:hypothetical protein